MRMAAGVAGVALLLASASLTPAAAAPDPADRKAMTAERYVYFMHNLERQANIDFVEPIIRRAAKAGYNGVVFSDCKFFRWDEAARKWPHYEPNVRRVRKLCADLGLKFIPSVADQTGDLLSNDPNLAEGMPVKDAPFVVKGGRLMPADDLAIVNGSFEAAGADGKPAGWTVSGDVALFDEVNAADGKSSCRITGAGGVRQTLRVAPWRYYRLALKVRTQDLGSPRSFDVRPIGAGGRQLAHHMFGLQPSQDWTELDVILNTLESETVDLRIALDGGGGTAWIDAVRIEPGGLVNLIRRAACPFQAASPDGATVYAEGKDFSEARDPKLFNVGYPGNHTYWYEQPEVKALAGGRLKEGDRVLLSYYHAMNTYGWGTFACMAEPKTLERVAWQMKNVHRVIEPDGYFMSHDEIRHQGYDDSCRRSGLTPAQLLAGNVKRCEEIIRAEDPGKPVFVWSDMFDPYHNAQKDGKPYYLVAGTQPWHGSWEGLGRDVIIANWNKGFFGHPEWRLASMQFFAGRGHRQILTHSDPSKIGGWLEEAQQVRRGGAGDDPSIVGVMFTVWDQKYDKLEAFGEAIEAWSRGRSAGVTTERTKQELGEQPGN